MDLNVTPMTASEWASTVSAAHYKKHRDELDSLLIGPVPGYNDKVAVTLDAFAQKVRDGQAEYDAEHDVARLLHPITPIWFRSILWWISLLGGISAFAILVGRRGYVEGVDWDLRAQLASLAFAAGVAAQLIRALPLRWSVPPRFDPSVISTAFGAATLGIMIWAVSSDESLSAEWVIITGIALAASVIYSISHLIARRRDRELTSRVDSLEEDRLAAASRRLEQCADDCADALEADFGALAAEDQKAVKAELAEATRVLRERGIIDSPTATGAQHIRVRATRHLRPFFPGFLLLEKLVQDVWDLPHSPPGLRPRVNWFIAEYRPKSRKSKRENRTSTAMHS